MAFRFGRAAITDKSHDDTVRAHWTAIQEHVERVNETSPLAFLGSDPDPDGTRDELAASVGRLPVVYVVHRGGVVRYHSFTLFDRPLCHVESQDLTDWRTRTALGEVVRMMKESLGNIIVYRNPLCPLQLEPDWWMCEPAGKRGKTWQWRPFLADEGTWRKREELLDQIVPGARASGLTARQVLTLFDHRQDRCSLASEMLMLAYARV